ncbi:MAG: outer membrane lipoprotein-sorting protein [Candidatus Rokubacteria bacterium]|nr:outer membrane lipoprotein-sorting protein [Candidatus Rokubacteria bacterium]
MGDGSRSRLPWARPFLCFLLASAVAWVPGAAWPQSGRDIMRKQRELQRPRDEQATALMRLVNKDGAVKERRVVSYTLTGPGDLSKILIRFLAPRDVENTGLLTWEAKDGNDDQWLYLPATRKVKRIAASSKKNRFMGTDFAYEDLRPENLSLHRYTLVGSETMDGRECYVVEAVPATERQAADSGYSRRRLWIRKDIYYTVKQEYYDKKGALAKIAVHGGLVPVQGTIWRADDIDMQDVQAGTRTVFKVEHRAVDRGLNESLFTEAGLTRTGS